MIYQLKHLPQSAETAVGGKARTLAHLIQQGYPVPLGSCYHPRFFSGGKIDPQRLETSNG